MVGDFVAAGHCWRPGFVVCKGLPQLLGIYSADTGLEPEQIGCFEPERHSCIYADYH